MGTRYIYQCSNCSTSGVTTISDDEAHTTVAPAAVDCAHCGKQLGMELRNVVQDQQNPLEQNPRQFKNTVVLVRNAMRVVEDLHARDKDISAALYDLRYAIDEL